MVNVSSSKPFTHSSWERPFQHRKVWGCEIESDKKTADVTTYVGNHDFDQQRLRLNHQMGGFLTMVNPQVTIGFSTRIDRSLDDFGRYNLLNWRFPEMGVL